MTSDEKSTAQAGSDPHFATTHWSVVAAAGHRSSPGAAAALESLCQTYWYPLYAYVRRRGKNQEDARELTQEFFARLLDGDSLQKADQERGRFRAYLLTLLKRFLATEHTRQQTQKRGGHLHKLSLDFQTAEARYQYEPVDEWTAEKIYERQWALTLLDRVMQRLGDEYRRRDKGPLFDACQLHLLPSADQPRYQTTAAQLDMSENAVRTAVHRMRQRYRELLLGEVAQTVATEQAIDDELAHLRAAVRGDAQP